MKRVLFSVSFIGLSAVVLNLAVAWSCTWWRPTLGGPKQTPSFWKQPNSNAWMGPGQFGLGWTEITLFGSPNLTPAGYDSAQWLPGWINPPIAGPVEQRAVLVMSAGWPARCLRARLVGRGDHSPGAGGAIRTGPGPQRVHWDQWEHAIIVDGSFSLVNHYRVVPTGVIASGMILNLLFWSLPALLIAGLFLARRFVRRRRLCCPACGYPVGSSEVCTECGRKVRERRLRSTRRGDAAHAHPR